MYIDRRNWTQSPDPTVSKADAPSAPPPGSDLAFDGSYSSAPCFWGNGPSNHKSLSLKGGYAGVVTMGPAVTVETFLMDSGQINQDATSTLTVTKKLQWYGGILDGSPSTPSQVIVTGAGTTADVYSVSALETADTLRIEAGAELTILFGNTIAFTGGNGIAVTNAAVTATSSLTYPVQFFDLSPGTPTVTLNDGGTFRLKSNNPAQVAQLNSELPFVVGGAAAKLQVDGNTVLSVSGVLPNAPTVGVRLSAGTIRLATTATIAVGTNTVALTGGSFLVDPVQPDSTATVVGSLTNSGAAVSFNTALGNYGILEVTLNATWTGGTYTPVFAMTGQGKKQSFWRALGTFTVGVGAVFAINVPSGQLASGDWWSLIEGGGGIVGNPPAGPPGFGVAAFDGNTVWRLTKA